MVTTAIDGDIILWLVFVEAVSPVETKCVQIDFGDGLEIYDRISSELQGLEIGLLGTAATCYSCQLLLNGLRC